MCAKYDTSATNSSWKIDFLILLYFFPILFTEGSEFYFHVMKAIRPSWIIIWTTSVSLVLNALYPVSSLSVFQFGRRISKGFSIYGLENHPGQWTWTSFHWPSSKKLSTKSGEKKRLKMLMDGKLSDILLRSPVSLRLKWA